jgi:hypothetical protein
MFARVKKSGRHEHRPLKIAERERKRVHSAIGHITPDDELEGKEKKIFAERDRKLNEARDLRKIRCKKQKQLAKEQLNAVSNYMLMGSIYP